MRSFMLILVLALASAGPTAGEDVESTEGTAAAEGAEQASTEASGDAPAAPVSEVRSDDRFLPTERLRYDQEVDYPTDI